MKTVPIFGVGEMTVMVHAIHCSSMIQVIDISEPRPECHSKVTDQCNNDLPVACDIVPQTKSNVFSLPQQIEV